MVGPNWQDLCGINRADGQEWDDISIELSCGLKIEGRIHYEHAKQLLREPTTMLPIDRNAQDGEVVIVLPISRIRKVSYPTELPLDGETEKES